MDTSEGDDEAPAPGRAAAGAAGATWDIVHGTLSALGTVLERPDLRAQVADSLPAVFPGAWMAWNLGLAALPLGARPQSVRARPPAVARWWVGLVAFVALLPNAPYVLTDIIHFDDAVRASDSDLWVAFASCPPTRRCFVGGFACYVASVVRLERWLRGQGWTLPQLLGADITVHALCAVGVFLGRVFRFNSWDLLARPHDIAVCPSGAGAPQRGHRRRPLRGARRSARPASASAWASASGSSSDS